MDLIEISQTHEEERKFIFDTDYLFLAKCLKL
jgi:hypothetical protein